MIDNYIFLISWRNSHNVNKDEVFLPNFERAEAVWTTLLDDVKNKELQMFRMFIDIPETNEELCAILNDNSFINSVQLIKSVRPTSEEASRSALL